MYYTAQRLCDRDGLNIECKYLYGSRYAWRMPQYSLEGENCLELICRGGIDVTFEKIMKRGGLTDEEAFSVAEELGFLLNYRQVLSYNDVMQLKKPLKESRLFLKNVYKHSHEAYETTVGYFSQEGLFDEVKYALVDSGWTGSLQKTLYSLLQHAGYQKRIEGFYFGLYELPKGVTEKEYSTFYFSPNAGLKKKVMFSNCLYEAVYSAPHGMTKAYESNNNYYRPVFYNKNNLNQTQMEQEVIWLNSFLSQYCEYKNANSNLGKGNELIFKLFKIFMGCPNKEEVECYGQLIFSDDVTEEHTQNVAIKFNDADIKNHYVWNKVLIMLGIKKQKLKDSAWIEGSVVLNEKHNAQQLRNVRAYKYLIYIRKWLKRGK